MNPTVQQFLESFDGMSVGVQREIALEILRRTKMIDLTPLSDQELTEAAEQVFLMLDAAEAGDGQNA